MKIICSTIFFLASLLLLSSCGNSQNTSNDGTLKTTSVDTTKFVASMVDNKFDPSCGMPVTAGIGDTVHYKGKVIGFCSKECKDDFLKDPEKNIAKASMKK